MNNKKYQPKVIKCRNFKDYQPEAMCNEINDIDWHPLYESTNVNDAVDYFNTSVKAVFDRHAPPVERKLRGKPCPWITHETKRKMDRRDQILRKARKHKKPEDWGLYRRLRNSINNDMKRNKASHHHDLLQENKLNPSKFWNVIKSLFPTKGAKVTTSSTYTDSQSKANKFCEYFSTIVKTLKQRAIPLRNFIWKLPNFIPLRTVKRFRFGYVAKIAIEKQLKTFQRKKATGVDDLPTSLLKDCASSISSPICHIVNLSIKTGTVPLLWKTAKLTPVFKAGDPVKPESYRPISVLPALSKILERAVHSQFSEYLECNDLLTDVQFGYRRKRSTTSAAIIFVDDVRREMDKGKLTGAVFLDLTKAFDTISHGVLLEKVKSYEVDDQELKYGLRATYSKDHNV
jgi:hypothetical protein